MAGDRYLGVDGCKVGWFFVTIGPGQDSEFGIFENIERLFNAYSDAKSILIDIAIRQEIRSQTEKLLSKNPDSQHSIDMNLRRFCDRIPGDDMQIFVTR